MYDDGFDNVPLDDSGFIRGELFKFKTGEFLLGNTVLNGQHFIVTGVLVAWVEWREKNEVEAEKFAREALELWHGMDDPYSMDWMALWPLIAIGFARKDIAGAIKFANGLLQENQHPPPENLLAAVRNACEEWQNGVQEKAVSGLAEAIKIARELHYI